MRRYLTNPDHALDLLVGASMIACTLGIFWLLGLAQFTG